MPLPSAITDLNVTPNLNSPQGTDTVGTQANDYIQALSAFIRQIYNGAIAPLAAVNFGGQKATGIAAGTISASSTDAVNGSQLYKVGEFRWWYGAAANIASVWGPGWQVMDGTNGYPDMRNKMPIGAGSTYALGATGGAATVALVTANLPAHNHPVIDNGHSHSFSDPGHIHNVNDPGHSHAYRDSGGNNASIVTTNGGNDVGGAGTGSRVTTSSNTQNSLSGTYLSASGTNCTIGTNPTGISVGSTGSGSAVNILPPYLALLPLIYVGVA